MKLCSLATPCISVLMLCSSTVFAATQELVVDLSTNLYYSGLVPKNKTALVNYYGTNIPPFKYPTTPVPWDDYRDTGLHDCPRNVEPVNSVGAPVWDGSETEVDPATAGAAVNTLADSQRGCYGNPPLLLDVSAFSGNELYIHVKGHVDDDTKYDYSPAPIQVVDARGQLGSQEESASDNGVNHYGLLGAWANNLQTNNLETWVDEAYDSDNNDSQDQNRTALIGQPGFDVVGGSEFGLIEGFRLAQSSSFVDGNNDGISDSGSGEFYGKVTIPAGATHLLLGYNAHKGGYYHHGDALYTGRDPVNDIQHPLYDTVPLSIRQDTTSRFYLTDNVPPTVDEYAADEGFAGVIGPYPDNHTRAVGVFMMTVSDAAIPGLSLVDHPTVTLTADKLSGQAPLAVEFSSAGSIANSGNLSNHIWSIDGADQQHTGSTATWNKTFTTAGSYDVSLLLRNSAGGSDTAAITIDVQAASIQPTASLSANGSSGTAPFDAVFDASSSSGNGDSITEYVWTVDTETPVTGASPTLNRTFTALGQHTVQVEVRTASGGTDIASVTINVTEASVPQPQASITADKLEGVAPLLVNFDAAASTGGDSNISAYRWQIEGQNPVETTTASHSHTFTDAGTYNLTIEIENEAGGTDAATLQIQVSAPVAVNDEVVEEETSGGGVFDGLFLLMLMTAVLSQAYIRRISCRPSSHKA